jgi:hypothetical protein
MPAAVLDRWQGSFEDMVNRTQYHASEQFLSARRWRIRYLPVPPPPRFATSLRAAPGQLRHMPGPNAAPFVGWRASMTDEQWVDWNALSDGAWYDAVQRDFGLDARRS